MTDQDTSSINPTQNSAAAPRVSVVGGDAFNYLQVELLPGQAIVTESGAMASMDAGVGLKTRMNGGIIRAVLMRFLGKESIFINRFFNKGAKPQNLILTSPTPGQIISETLNGGELFIQTGAFIACTEGIRFSVRFAGISSWLGGEGLFRLRIHGIGTVWYGAYGAVVEKDIDGDFVVDTGHLLSYPDTIQLKIQLSGGIFSSFFGGEGLVLRLVGRGRVRLQTRSLGGLASWLNPWFGG